MRLNCQNVALTLWVIAAMLMLFATTDSRWLLVGWSLLVGQGALTFSVSALITHSRRVIVQIVESEDEKVERFAGAVLGALDESGKAKPRPPRI